MATNQQSQGFGAPIFDVGGRPTVQAGIHFKPVDEEKGRINQFSADISNTFLKHLSENPELLQTFQSSEPEKKNIILQKAFQDIAQNDFGWEPDNQETLARTYTQFLKNVNQPQKTNFADSAMNQFINDLTFGAQDRPAEDPLGASAGALGAGLTKNLAGTALGAGTGALLGLLTGGTLSAPLAIAGAGVGSGLEGLLSGYFNNVDRQQDVGVPVNQGAALTEGGVEGLLNVLPIGKLAKGKKLLGAALDVAANATGGGAIEAANEITDPNQGIDPKRILQAAAQRGGAGAAIKAAGLPLGRLQKGIDLKNAEKEAAQEAERQVLKSKQDLEQEALNKAQQKVEQIKAGQDIKLKGEPINYFKAVIRSEAEKLYKENPKWDSFKGFQDELENRFNNFLNKNRTSPFIRELSKRGVDFDSAQFRQSVRKQINAETTKIGNEPSIKSRIEVKKAPKSLYELEAESYAKQAGREKAKVDSTLQKGQVMASQKEKLQQMQLDFAEKKAKQKQMIKLENWDLEREIKELKHLASEQEKDISANNRLKRQEQVDLITQVRQKNQSAIQKLRNEHQKLKNKGEELKKENIQARDAKADKDIKRADKRLEQGDKRIEQEKKRQDIRRGMTDPPQKKNLVRQSEPTDVSTVDEIGAQRFSNTENYKKAQTLEDAAIQGKKVRVKYKAQRYGDTGKVLYKDLSVVGFKDKVNPKTGEVEVWVKAYNGEDPKAHWYILEGSQGDKDSKILSAEKILDDDSFLGAEASAYKKAAYYDLDEHNRLKAEYDLKQKGYLSPEKTEEAWGSLGQLIKSQGEEGHFDTALSKMLNKDPDKFAQELNKRVSKEDLIRFMENNEIECP